MPLQVERLQRGQLALCFNSSEASRRLRLEPHLLAQLLGLLLVVLLHLLYHLVLLLERLALGLALLALLRHDCLASLPPLSTLTPVVARESRRVVLFSVGLPWLRLAARDSQISQLLASWWVWAFPVLARGNLCLRRPSSASLCVCQHCRPCPAFFSPEKQPSQPCRFCRNLTGPLKYLRLHTWAGDEVGDEQARPCFLCPRMYAAYVHPRPP